MRASRAARALTRQQLAERSGVSLRYIAQLEAGAGNVSLNVLHRLAGALETRVATLVGDDAPPEAARVAALLAAAPEAQRRRVLEMLATPARARRIALIGLRGAGKTTLGRLAGARLGWPFVELNREIEALSGLAVNEVIALYGPEGYRRLERQALERVAAAHENLVLAAAGGVVTEPETFDFLQSHFHTIWLKAAPQEHMNRVRAQGDTRPMSGHPRAMAELNALLGVRETLYARADAVVDTTGRAPPESLETLIAAMRRLGVA